MRIIFAKIFELLSVVACVLSHYGLESNNLFWSYSDSKRMH